VPDLIVKIFKIQTTMNKEQYLQNPLKQALNISVVSGMCLFNVVATRNYYGETQTKQVQIEGETLDRARFYYNTSNLFWYV